MSHTNARDDATRVWDLFRELSSIPRCSGHEGAVRDWVRERVAAAGCEVDTDATGNLVARRRASGGAAPMVVLQGHLDMVCEKNRGVDHDFTTDGIVIERDGEWLTAKETTLGADNGIAVAMMVALLEDDAMAPLECLFTIDEESGLRGAMQLDPAIVTGRLLINLDSEEEGYVYIGCAGGVNQTLTLPIVTQTPPEGRDAVRLAVTGLFGGHSGVDIALQRGNAIQIGARILDALGETVQIAAVNGGDKHNAIPREFFAEITFDGAHRADIEKTVAHVADEVRAEFAGRDGGLSVTLEATASPAMELTASSSRAVVDLLRALPHGVITMSDSVAGLVETSTNLASVATRGAEVTILTSQRSMRDSQIEHVAGIVGAAARLAGATARRHDAYPAWTPTPGGELLKTVSSVWHRETGAEPTVTAIHAGLECGLIGARVGGMEMVSLGPDIRDPHTPNERVHVASTERVFRTLRTILREIWGA